MIKRILIMMGYFLFCNSTLSAQLTYGVTGLLHTPSAEMQRDKTVMLGGNFMNKEITPPIWSYHTYNYFLNITVFPWLEVAYTCTLFQSQTTGVNWKVGKGKFTNQDRYFSVRARVLREEQFWKDMPAIVIGTSDPFTESGDGEIASTNGNGYFSRFFVAMSKHFFVGKGKMGIHLSYLYNNRNDYSLNGVAGGISYLPSMLPNLKLIVEYDSKDFAFGGTYLLFNHLHAQIEMQKMAYLTGGLIYKIYLK